MDSERVTNLNLQIETYLSLQLKSVIVNVINNFLGLLSNGLISFQIYKLYKRHLSEVMWDIFYK